MSREQTCLQGVARSTLTEWRIKKYVILSASEISHQTIALLVVIARHEVPRQSHWKSTRHILRRPPPSREIASSFHFLAMTNKKYVILSVGEISHRKSEHCCFRSSQRSTESGWRQLIVKQNPSLCLKQGVSGMWRRPILPDSCQTYLRKVSQNFP